MSSTKPAQPPAPDELTAPDKLTAPDEPQASARERRLWRSIVGLAEPPPETVPGGDSGAGGSGSSGDGEKLVFEFDEAYTAYVEAFETLPSEAQMLALQAVDTQVASMVAMKEASLWSLAARRTHPVWAELQERAARVLLEFDWPDHTE